MRLAEPWALLPLLLIPVLLYLHARRRRPAALGYSATGDLGPLARTPTALLHAALPWLRALALALCVVALARPQWGLETTEVHAEGIAIVMAVDISSSMGALDLTMDNRQTDRLEVVKRTFVDFVEGDAAELTGRDGDLIGLLTFARFADGLSPLTLDHTALLSQVDQVTIVPLPEEDGTAIGDAIVMGVERLRRAAGSSRVLILLTDGSNNAGDTAPLQAAQIAQALGIKVYTIGAGSRGIALMPVRARGGGTELRQTQVYIDEHTLTQIAELTGGRYFRATDGAALRAIYAEIDRLEKARNVADHYQRYVEGFPVFVLAAFGLLLFEIAMVNTRLRTVP